MKKARYAFVAVMLAVSVMLSGCQLAQEEKEFSQDKLVGISVLLGSPFVTKGGEGYFDRALPHEPDGALIWLKTDYTEEGVARSGAAYEDSNWFEPAHIHFTVNDEGEEHALETTLYLAEKMLPENPYLQMEHVYQREDGTLYAVNAGSNYSGNLDGLGLRISQSYSAAYPSGEKRKQSISIKLNVKYEEIVLSAEAVEMKGTGEEIARHQLTGQEELWVSPETEWLLIEETLSDFSIRRTAVNGPLNKKIFFIYTPELPGVCIRETYTIRTPGVLSGETQPG